MSKIITPEQIYNNTSNQDRELFIKQLHYFREIMCSNKYTQERKDEEFGNLFEAYLRCDLNEEDITLFMATKEEFERRNTYTILLSSQKDDKE